MNNRAVTNPKKLRRALRLMYAKDMRRMVQKDYINSFFKPRPKFWPQWLFGWMTKKVIKI